MIAPINWAAALTGTLFTFGYNDPQLTAFHSGPVKTPNALILLPGVTEGQLSLPWAGPLSAAAAQRGWSTVHPTLSSSYNGFGTGSLKRDIGELDLLVEHLIKQGKKRILMIGHSTGSQQSLYFARFAKQRASLVGCVLHGAVSDREAYVNFEPQHDLWISIARKMVQQKNGEEMMPRKAYPFAPVTANRFLSFIDKNGDDDMFSSDLAPAQLKAIYAPVNVPLAMIQSGNDEFIPVNVKKEKLLSNAKSAYSNFLTLEIIPNVDHTVTSASGQTALVNIILSFIDKLKLS
ncbi:hypothetical protein BDF19DRAFT_496784 [Syncephalis fuscata]|nr:hypothetical protein BDF19DRAFT_496784 [Syncephalis fuscata]